jgi:hypothetical protein
MFGQQLRKFLELMGTDERLPPFLVVGRDPVIAFPSSNHAPNLAVYA